MVFMASSPWSCVAPPRRPVWADVLFGPTKLLFATDVFVPLPRIVSAPEEPTDQVDQRVHFILRDGFSRACESPLPNQGSDDLVAHRTL